MDINSLLKKIIDTFRSAINLVMLLRPLTDNEKSDLKELEEHLSKDEIHLTQKYLKQKRITLVRKNIRYSSLITDKKDHIAIEPKYSDMEDKTAFLNRSIETSIDTEIFGEFKKDAWQRLQKIFANNIVGFESVKKGAILQLFSKDQFHILLLGDPGTGKTDILRASENLAPVSAFGLGSGTTNTGLTVTVSGNEISKGILSIADNGIALIDELNLMKKEDRAGLYNAMEKGFITYDKGGHHYRFDARCCVLSSANPKKGKFSGTSKKEIAEEIPFDSALLSRFHLIYLIREATLKQFMEITEKVFSGKKNKISENDCNFIKKYIERAKSHDVAFSVEHNEMIKQFVLEIKEKEKDMLIDITPRFVIGLKRLIEASARVSMKTKPEKEDVWRAMEVFTLSMKDITF